MNKQDPNNMNIYRNVENPDPEEMSAMCLVGRTLHDVVASGPSCWVFQFGEGCSLTIESSWRVLDTTHIVVTDIDHEQQFGLPEPKDARMTALEAIGKSPVTESSYAPVTGDLRVVFSNGTVLEALTNSCGYESWILNRPDGKMLVATGGGRVVLVVAYTPN